MDRNTVIASTLAALVSGVTVYSYVHTEGRTAGVLETKLENLTHTVEQMAAAVTVLNDRQLTMVTSLAEYRAESVGDRREMQRIGEDVDRLQALMQAPKDRR